MGSIVCIGQSVLDITMPLEEAIVENQKYRIMEKLECGGGPAFNSAYLCGKWQADTYLISRIGQDAYGEALRDVIQKEGVHLNYLIQDETLKTPYSYIFTNKKNGSRTIFNFPGNVKKVEYVFPQIEVDVILSDGHEPDISVEAIRNYPDAISIIDAGTYRESTMTVAKEVDYLVCSEDFARQYTGQALDLDDWQLCQDIFAKIEQINHKNVVITMGEKGLLYKEHGMVKHMKAYPAKAVDTTGAGDIFHGAFAYGVYKKMAIEDVLKLSSMTAAISVETMGGQPSIPEIKTVFDRMKVVNY